jgi:hypothetical protein
MGQVKLAASLFPDAILEVVQNEVYELFFRDSIHILDWIFKNYSNSIHWAKLFELFIDGEDLSLGITSLNGLQWLVDKGVKLREDFFEKGVEGNFHTSYFLFLLDNKCPLPANVTDLLAASPLNDSLIAKRILSASSK